MPSSDNNAVGILFAWDYENIVLFVEKANDVNQKSDVVKPRWLNVPDGRITPNSFMRDMIEELKSVGSGESFEIALLGPNTLVQYSHVLFELANIQSHPYMQAVMKEVVQANPAAHHLVTLGVIRDNNRPAESLGPFRESPPSINMLC